MSATEPRVNELLPPSPFFALMNVDGLQCCHGHVGPLQVVDPKFCETWNSEPLGIKIDKKVCLNNYLLQSTA